METQQLFVELFPSKSTSSHHFGRSEAQHFQVSGLPGRSLLITVFFLNQTITEKNTLHRRPCRIRAFFFLRTFGWFVMCKPLWSVHGLHRLQGFVFCSELQERQVNITYRWVSHHILYVFKENVLCVGHRVWPGNSRNGNNSQLGFFCG